MNILFVNNQYDFSIIENGAGHRSAMFVRALSNIGHVDIVDFCPCKEKSNVDNINFVFSDFIATPDPLDIEGYVSRLSKFRALLTPWIPESVHNTNTDKERIIDDIVSAGQYDLIAVRYLWEVMICGLAKYKDRLIVDMDDNPKDVYLSKKKHSKTFLQKCFYFGYAYANDILVKTLSKHIKCIYYPNKNQKPAKKAIYLPNVSANDKHLPLCDYGKTENIILFIGTMWYYPNYLGIDYFINKVFSKIKKTVPDAKLNIVGRNAPEYYIEKWGKNEGVNVKGFVNDLYAEYEQCRVIVAPIYYGAGTAIKVIEAMNLRRPVVSSPYGIRGLDDIFVSGEDYILANDAESFATAVVNVMQSEELNHKLSENAFKKVQKNFSKEIFTQILTDSINSLS